MGVIQIKVYQLGCVLFVNLKQYTFWNLCKFSPHPSSVTDYMFLRRAFES